MNRFASALVLATTVLACSSTTTDSVDDQQANLTLAPFPSSFTFGTAIAGFQVDMGCPSIDAAKCEDRASDWYQWITTPRLKDNPLLFIAGDPPSSGPGFFELHPQDMQRASDELHSGGLRLSLEWSRIFPKPTWGIESHSGLRAIANPDGLAYYRRLLGAMKMRGQRPFVTVNHYTLPLWVHDGDACNQSLDVCVLLGKGGWADSNRSRIVHEIAKFAGFVAEEFGGDVDRWATLNEPFSAVVLPSYLLSTPMRSNPPGVTGRVDAAKTATIAMIEAHARMYDAIKAHDRVDADGDGKAAEVGIVYAFSEIAPASTSADDKKAAEHAQYLFHDMFMDGVVFGRIDESWTGEQAAPRADLVGRMDFIGLNYYFRFEARRSLVPLTLFSPLLDFDPTAPFEPTPKGIGPAILRVAERYRLPIWVTETGTPQDDAPRGAAWVVQSLSGVRAAMTRGADVRGFYAWSLIDNYEWNQGMHTHYGLYSVDPATKARTRRESGTVYSEIAGTRTVSEALQNKYASFFPVR